MPYPCGAHSSMGDILSRRQTNTKSRHIGRIGKEGYPWGNPEPYKSNHKYILLRKPMIIATFWDYPVIPVTA